MHLKFELAKIDIKVLSAIKARQQDSVAQNYEYHYITS